MAQNLLRDNPQEYEDALFRHIGKKIKHFRNTNNIKQETLASLVNISRSSIVNIELGKQNPSLILIFLIAEALDVNVYELIPNKIELNSIKELFNNEILTKDSQQKLELFLAANINNLKDDEQKKTKGD